MVGAPLYLAGRLVFELSSSGSFQVERGKSFPVVGPSFSHRRTLAQALCARKLL